MHKQELLIVKIGGNIIDDKNALDSFLSAFASISKPKILIHGGGKIATDLSKIMGIETKMHDGRRITGEGDLQVVEMTYAGWINKAIAAKLNAKNNLAIGLSGVDGKLIPAVKRPVKDIDYGFVGDLLSNEVNVGLLDFLLKQKAVPVIAPITADKVGNLLNVNADTVAQVLAESLSNEYTVNLVYCFERNGLLLDTKDENSVIHEINFEKAKELKAKGTISAGMIPKTDNALSAVKNGVDSVVIGHAKDILQLASKENNCGTRFSK